MFFDDGLAGAEGYDEHVQGLDIYQLGLVNGISVRINGRRETYYYEVVCIFKELKLQALVFCCSDAKVRMIAGK
jgi:hypothetical protein